MSAKTDNKLLWKFIYKTFLLVLLPTLLFLAAYEIAYRNIPNSYSLKKEYLDRCADSIDVLVLGSSHTFQGVNPCYFSINTFNAANPAQTLDYDIMIYNKYFKGKPNPKYVVLSMSYFSLWVKSLGTESWRSRKYSIYMGIGCEYNYFDLNAYEFRLGDMTPIFYYLLGKRTTDVAHNGFVFSECEYDNNFNKCGEDAAKRHSVDIFKNQYVYEENVKLIDNLLADCVKFNKKVIFLTTPGYKTYRDAIPLKQIERTVMLIDSIHREYPDNTLILNLFHDPRFVKSDFYNADHLCSDGAAKLSIILNDTIHSSFDKSEL